jgi:LSD1 subclass zinc finger protein
MKRIGHATIAILAPSLFFFGSISLVGVGVSAQKQRPKRRVDRPAVTRPTTLYYSRFSHSTQKHQGACNTCHRVPTDNWKKVRAFPDVADYPGHDACVGCHRPQFFKGAKPVICSICHAKVSPREDERFPFRNLASPRQFFIEFPHDKHQDVIASLFRRLPQQGPSLFQRVSFTSSSFTADEKTKHYNNCEICHGLRTNAPATPSPGWVDAFVPDAAAFQATPRSHAECFTCHWKSQQPTNDNCGGCHKLKDKPYYLLDTPVRLSMKFRHAREQHVAECTTCHINITKATTSRGLKPDVPITSCTECHNKDGLRLDVSKELEALDKNRDFVCSYCHTSDIGRRDPPSSHYLIAGREPLTRKDIK